MGWIKEFREFALKGNALDLAVGVIIGGAFGGIVNSLIGDVIMPLVSMAGNVDYSNWYIGLSSKVWEAQSSRPARPLTLEEAKAIGPVLAYGKFITVMINFLILAFCIFVVVKAFNTARKRFEAEKAAPPPSGPSGEEKLLIEIRDLLAKKV